jgi:hypothetical protein
MTMTVDQSPAPQASSIDGSGVGVRVGVCVALAVGDGVSVADGAGASVTTARTLAAGVAAGLQATSEPATTIQVIATRPMRTDMKQLGMESFLLKPISMVLSDHPFLNSAHVLI